MTQEYNTNLLSACNTISLVVYFNADSRYKRNSVEKIFTKKLKTLENLCIRKLLLLREKALAVVP